MAKGKKIIFLDTSFILAMLKPDEATHDSANRYFEYWVKAKHVIVVSSIVISELRVYGHELPPEFVSHVVPVSFTPADGRMAAKVWWARNKDRPNSQKRSEFKDDMKIIGHAIQYGAFAIAHMDKDTMDRYIKDTVTAKLVARNLRSVLIGDVFDETTAMLSDAKYVQTEFQEVDMRPLSSNRT